MNNLFSNLDKYQLKYFYVANISFIVLMSIPGFYVTLLGRSPFNTHVLLLLFVCLLFTSLYVILAIIGIKHIPARVNISETEANIENHETDLKTVHKQLLAFFEKEKPWISPNLNIWETAKKIGSNRSYVSKVINDEIGCNFNQFVNGYRVEEAKQLLIKTPLIPIAEISELSGFGSVNSFIRIFKASEKCTPTQFRNNH